MQCDYCGRDISPSAYKCPRCGNRSRTTFHEWEKPNPFLDSFMNDLAKAEEEEKSARVHYPGAYRVLWQVYLNKKNPGLYKNFDEYLSDFRRELLRHHPNSTETAWSVFLQTGRMMWEETFEEKMKRAEFYKE